MPFSFVSRRVTIVSLKLSVWPTNALAALLPAVTWIVIEPGADPFTGVNAESVPCSS